MSRHGISCLRLLPPIHKLERGKSDQNVTAVIVGVLVRRKVELFPHAVHVAGFMLGDDLVSDLSDCWKLPKVEV